MDDPAKQIEGVVRALTQGSPNEQATAVKGYFVPNAEFVHPFCRVPPFENVAIPLLGEVNSRQLILAIFRWYRIISPRIDLKVNSALLDEANNKLYVDISQRFGLWFVPFMVANVNLVTVLHLTKTERSQPSSNRRLGASGARQTRSIENGSELPSFAEVASSNTLLLSVVDKSAVTSMTSRDAAIASTEGFTTQADDDGDESQPQFYITKQQDLYQVNEWIKFIVPFGIGNAVITAGQLFATFLCLAGAVAFFPVVWVLTRGGASGNVMPPVKSVQDDGGVTWKT